MSDLNLDIIIGKAQAAQTIGEIRAQLKELKNAMLQVGEGTEEFNKLAMAAGELKERMNEANEAVAAFNPDAMEAVGNFAGKAAAGVSLVTGAMGLLGEKSEETEKMLMKVQAAMAFAQGIQGIKGLGKAFQNLFNIIAANPIVTFLVAITALGAAIYKVYSAQQAANSELAKATAEYEKQKKITSELSAQYERDIELLEAQGASTEDIIAVKRQLIEVQIAEAKTSLAVHEAKLKEVEATDSLWESLLMVAEATAKGLGNDLAAEGARNMIAENKKERAEEELTQIEEQKQAILDLENQLKILDIQEEKNNETKNKNYAEQKERDEKQEQDLLAGIEQRRQLAEQEQEEIEQREFELWQYKQGLRKRDLEEHKEYIEKKREAEYKQYLERRAQAKRERQMEIEDRDFKLSALSSLFGSISQLMSKNAKAQKAFAVAQTLIDTYMAAQKAYASQLSIPSPDAPIRAQIAAGLAILSGLARVKAILSVDTNGTSSGGGSMSSTDSGSLQVSTQPNMNPSAQPSTLINEQGQVSNSQNQQYFVSVVEIMGVGQGVQAAEDRARV